MKGQKLFGKWGSAVDISTPLHNDMDKYPSLVGFNLQWIRKIEKKDKLNMSKISMESHVGTHVDAPLHFIKGGKSVGQMPLWNLMGQAQVIEVAYPQTVTWEFLKEKYKGVQILLFKFGKKRYNREFDYFDLTAVKFFLKNNIKAIGTDNFTVDSKNTKYEIHQAILGRKLWIVEGLNLEKVSSGVFDFICLPLAIRDGEGAPARAILFQRESVK